MGPIPRPLLLLASAGVLGLAPLTLVQVNVVTVDTPAASAAPAAPPIQAPYGAPAPEVKVALATPCEATPAPAVAAPAPAQLEGYDKVCVDPKHPALAGELPIIVMPRRLPSGAPLVGNTLSATTGGRTSAYVTDKCGTKIGWADGEWASR